MSDCRFGVSPVNYPDPDPERIVVFLFQSDMATYSFHRLIMGKVEIGIYCYLNVDILTKVFRNVP